MDRRKIRRQEGRKIQLGSQISNSRENFIVLDELQIKPNTKMPVQLDNLDLMEKPINRFSVSRTNLKIKQAHSITLKDFFSAQKESIMEGYKPKKNEKQHSKERITKTSQTSHKRLNMNQKLQPATSNNPIHFYNKSNNSVVEQILKQCKIQMNESKHSRSTFSKGGDDNLATIHINNGYNGGIEQGQLNSQGHLMSSQFNGENLIQSSQNVENCVKNSGNQVFQPSFNKGYHSHYNLVSRETLNSPPLTSITKLKPLTIKAESKQTKNRDFLWSPTPQMADRCREAIANPKKYYQLNSLGFKNYKYPRPQEMPYEKQGEKRTRMPLYLMPQSAPSREIEEICIGKYREEVGELEHNIEESNQREGEMNGLSDMVQDLERTKLNYENEIEFIQGRVNALSSSTNAIKWLKTNAKYTFPDSNSKALSTMSLRSNRIEDISDKLSRTKSKIESQITRTKAHINRILQEHNSYVQQSLLTQNRQFSNKNMHQVYKELVARSDLLRNTPNYSNNIQSDSIINLPNEPIHILYSNENSSRQLASNENLPNDYQHHIQEEEEADEDLQNEMSHLRLQINEQNDYIRKHILNQQNNKDVIYNEAPLIEDSFTNDLKEKKDDQDAIDMNQNQYQDQIGPSKTRLGELMMKVLIDTFDVLKQNRIALRDRIILALGLNPQDGTQSVSKQQFEEFYSTLVTKTSTLNKSIDFIIKFFSLDDEFDEENSKLKNKQQQIFPKEEFRLILRLLTISVDEKTKGDEKSLFDYMLENLTLTEVLNPEESVVNLNKFRAVLHEGKINPKDIIDLICNLQ